MKFKSTQLAFVIFLIFSFQNTIWGENEAKIAKTFFQHGISLLEKGNVEGAIDDFSRSLLVDPTHELSQKRLITLSNVAQLQPDLKMQLLRFQDLTHFNQQLSLKSDYFEGKNVELLDALAKKGVTKESIKEKISLLNDDLISMDSHVVEANRQYQKEQSLPLVALNGTLNITKEELIMKIDYLQKQYDQLRGLYHEEDLPVIRKYKDETAKLLPMVKTELNVSDKKPKTETLLSIPPADNSVEKFKNNFPVVKQQFEDLQMRLNQREEKIAQLSRDLIDISLKLSEKDMILDDREASIASLNSEVIDLRSRFELGQKIIQEKDQQLASLQNEFNKFKETAKNATISSEQFTQKIINKDQDIAQLQGMLDIYKGQLKTASNGLKSKDVTIASLNNELMELKDKFQNFDLTMGNKDRTIDLLKNRLKEVSTLKEQRNENLRKVVKERDEKIDELEGVVSLYKGKLGSAFGTIEEKNVYISKLNKDLELVQSKIESKDALLQKTNDNLTLVERKIIELQQKFDKFELEKIPGEQSNLQNDINHIKTNIAEIHSLLKNDVASSSVIHDRVVIGEITVINDMLNNGSEISN